MPNEFSVFLEEKSDDTGTVRASLYNAADKNPDAYAKDVVIADKHNIPVSAAQSQRPAIERKDALAAYDFDSLVRDTPVIANHLQNKDNAILSKDDIGNMSYFERLSADYGQSAKVGALQTDVAEVDTFRLMGIGGELTPSEQLAVNRQKAFQQQDYNIDFFSGIPGAVRETLPLLAEQMKDAVPAALGGAGIGAAYGTAVPGAGTLTGAVTGLGRGFAGGLAFEFAKAEANNAYLEISALTDDQGNPIEREVAAGAALIAGTIGGALEMVGVGAIAKTFPGADKLKGAFTKDGISKLLKRPRARDAIAALGGRLIQAGTAEGATEALQEITTLMAREGAKMVSDGNFEAFTAEQPNSTFMDELLARTSDAFVQGAQGGLGFGVVGAGSNFAVDLRNVKRAEQNAAVFEAMGDAATNSKTLQRAPERHESLSQRG